ncbi:hypothetical protein DM01DRAFT_1349385 [Hesseltinella vesiculosa]|uniref:F-box domain-containing protein n=1 Tax=Hesseltinella vesiculosa TaxID=101127 RepID=A0A1X2G5D0_9FUNG|nr:hypothetical protein DM01DRAFT_1349385 [Hesseltinella vesiculosa]
MCNINRSLPENVVDKVLELCTMQDLITFSFTSRRCFQKVSRMGVWNEVMVNNGFPASLSPSAMAHVIHLHNENGLCERCQLFGPKPITPYTGSKGDLKQISVKQARKILTFPHGHPFVNKPVAMLAAALRYHGGFAGIVAALQTSAYMSATGPRSMDYTMDE